MIFRVTFKDPDSLQDAIKDAVRQEIAALPLTDDEKAHAVEMRCSEVEELAKRWFDYGEYLMVEIDTDAEKCTVVDK